LKEQWHVIGKSQFDFILSHGLERDMLYLDIGCGDFRAGRLVMEHIEVGNYYGIDNRSYHNGVIKVV